jgi:hypothetical protein
MRAKRRSVLRTPRLAIPVHQRAGASSGTFQMLRPGDARRGRLAPRLQPYVHRIGGGDRRAPVCIASTWLRLFEGPGQPAWASLCTSVGFRPNSGRMELMNGGRVYPMGNEEILTILWPSPRIKVQGFPWRRRSTLLAHGTLSGDWPPTFPYRPPESQRCFS